MLFPWISGRRRQVLWGKLRQGLKSGPGNAGSLLTEGRSRQLTSLSWNVLGTKRGPWARKERGGRLTSCQSSTYALDRDVGELPYTPLSAPGVHLSLWPTLWVWTRGSPTLEPRGYFRKALGLWERGMRDERFPHWWEWAQWILTGAHEGLPWVD